MAIRLLLVAEGDTYRVMPGGLVRCASSQGALPGLSLLEHTSSKDLWILSESPRSAVTPTNLPSHQPLRRSTGTLSSRAADNMLWIGRYFERAECATRILLQIIHSANMETAHAFPVSHRSSTPSSTSNSQPLKDLAEVTGDRSRLLETLLPVFFERPSKFAAANNSIPNNLNPLRSLAALSRNRLSNDSWRVIQGLASLVRQALPRTLSGFIAPLQQAILHQCAFNGTCRENLTRSESWRFLNIGRKMERSTWLLTLVDEILSLYPVLPSSVLDAALAVTDCTLTYRYRYQGAPTLIPTLDLLLYDPAIPRGLIYQLADLDWDFAALPPPGPEQILRPAHRTVQRALHHLQTELLTTENPENEAEIIKDLHQFISRLRKELPHVAEQLGWEFFTHATFTAS